MLRRGLFGNYIAAEAVSQPNQIVQLDYFYYCWVWGFKKEHLASWDFTDFARNLTVDKFSDYIRRCNPRKLEIIFLEDFTLCPTFLICKFFREVTHLICLMPGRVGQWDEIIPVTSLTAVPFFSLHWGLLALPPQEISDIILLDRNNSFFRRQTLHFYWIYLLLFSINHPTLDVQWGHWVTMKEWPAHSPPRGRPKIPSRGKERHLPSVDT